MFNDDAPPKYDIAFVKEDGGFELVGSFYANDDDQANRMMEHDWYLLRDGKNINGGQ
jgi:hypothetical protein